MTSFVELNPEPFVRRWSRRTMMYVMVFGGFVVNVATLPIWLPATLVVGVFRRASWSTTRAAVFVSYYLFCQVWALIGCLLFWLVSGAWLGVGRERLIGWMWWIQFAWSKVLGRGSMWIWGMREEIDWDYEFGDRPVIMFVRHASITDTLIPLVFICGPKSLRYKYVMKRELEWDPCIDLAVRRIGELFVQRGSEDSRGEVEAIGRMARGLGAREGVIIFPEGTRYSEAKRARIIEKLEESGDEELLGWARGYRRVLPPRMGGPLALLENNEGADAVFVAHTGLEKCSSFRESFNGGLVGTRVPIKIWGVRYEDIPEGEAARREWLLGEWKKVDDFIVSREVAEADQG